MIPITFKYPQRKTMESLFQRFFGDIKYDGLFKKLDLWCKDNIKLPGICGFKDVVLADYDRLVSIREYLSKNSNLDFPPRLQSYIYYTLYRKKFDRQLFIESLRVEACPYCNTEYLFYYKNKSNYQIDHFYPRGIYPLLTVSFCNLIPGCYACNLHKGEREIDYNPHNNRYKNSDEILKFFFWCSELNSYNPKSIHIGIIPLDKIIKKNIETFNLDELYEKYKFEIVNLMKKRRIYSEEAVDDLYKNFPDLFKSKKEIYRLIFGTSFENDDDIKNPLAKFRRDIFRQFDAMID